VEPGTKSGSDRNKTNTRHNIVAHLYETRHGPQRRRSWHIKETVDPGHLEVQDSCHFRPCLLGSAAGTGSAEGPGRMLIPLWKFVSVSWMCFWLGKMMSQTPFPKTGMQGQGGGHRQPPMPKIRKPAKRYSLSRKRALHWTQLTA